jgi:hypothetical protein
MSGRRYLTFEEAVAALRRGVEVEQMLGIDWPHDGGQGVIRWVTAYRHNERFSPLEGRFVLTRHEVIDIGSGSLSDISEFPPVDPEDYTGEGRRIADDSDPSTLLAVVATVGGRDDRWVNQGVIGEEYASLWASR